MVEPLKFLRLDVSLSLIEGPIDVLNLDCFVDLGPIAANAVQLRIANRQNRLASVIQINSWAILLLFK